MCLSCGGRGAWNAGRQELVCQSCGSAIEAPRESAAAIDRFLLLPRLRDSPDSGRDWQPRATHLRCRSCQSLIAYTEQIVGRSCEACGTPALVPCDISGAPVSPSGVLPFRITEADARVAVAEWLSSRVRGRRPAIDTIRAVYVPSWIFSANVSCRWRGEIQRTNRDGNSERIGIDGIVERTFEEMLIPAAASVPPKLLESIGPFPLADMHPFDSHYVAGSTVEVYARNMWDAWDDASARMQRELDAALRRDSRCPPSQLETWPEWREQRCAHVLVPVYIATYRHRKETYQAVVNGASAKVGGTSPGDLLVALAVLAVLLAVVGGIFYGLFRLLA